MNKRYHLSYDEIVEIFKLWQDDYLNDDIEDKVERSNMINDENYCEYCANYFINLIYSLKLVDDDE